MSLLLVSVVIPVRNGEAFIVDAVESVLAQQDVHSELIAVDDGSTDSTPDLLARFAGRIVIHRQRAGGLPAARNAGLALARGELLVFLDADDLQPLHYLARFAEAAAAAPHADVFHCGWRAIDSGGRFLYAQEKPVELDDDPFHLLAAGGSPPISALAVRRPTATRVGPFDETLTLQEDWDYWLRLAASGARFQNVPGNVRDPLRRHENSMSASAGARLAATGLAVLESHLSRHPRCPACVRSDAGLASWRRAVLQTSARELARRLHLPGRAGRLISSGLVVAGAPRLASAAFSELRERPEESGQLLALHKEALKHEGWEAAGVRHYGFAKLGKDEKRWRELVGKGAGYPGLLDDLEEDSRVGAKIAALVKRAVTPPASSMAAPAGAAVLPAGVLADVHAGTLVGVDVAVLAVVVATFASGSLHPRVDERRDAHWIDDGTLAVRGGLHRLLPVWDTEDAVELGYDRISLVHGRIESRLQAAGWLTLETAAAGEWHVRLGGRMAAEPKA